MIKHPVAWFYILAFSISWFGWIPIVAGSHGIAPFDNPYFQFLLLFPAIGPALAAVIVAKAAHGKTGIRDLQKALFKWHTGLVWYIVAVFGPFVLLIAGQVITKLFGFSLTHAEPQGDLFPLAISAFVMSLISNPWEEIGWRGFALPHLQKRYNALLATLIVGVLWGVWHLPLFFWVGNPMSEYSFLPWFIGTVAVAVIYTWLYNSTKGSVLLAVIFHVAINTFGVVVGGVSTVAMAILYFLVAVVLITVYGSKNLSRQERVYTG